MCHAKSIPAIVLILAVVAPQTCGQPKQPGVAPLDFRLIARRTEYPSAKPEAANGMPDCFVAIDVELKNTSDAAIVLSLPPEPALELTGPRPGSVRKISTAIFYVNQEHNRTIAPGEIVRVQLRSLTYRAGREQFQMLWSEPGEYVLHAVYPIEYRSGLTKQPPRALTLKSAPLKLTMRACSVTDYWVAALADRDQELRRTALLNLRDLGPRAQTATLAVVAMLKEKEPGIRMQAASTLAAMGPAVKARAMPALLQALKDADGEVQRTAIAALAQIAPKEKEVAAAFLPFLRHAEPYTRMAAASAMRNVPFNGGTVGIEHTTALLEALKAETVVEARRAIIGALCHHPRLEVVSALVPYITTDEKSTKFETLHTLGRIAPFLERDRKKNKELGRPIENAVAALIDAMKDAETLPHAVYVIGYFGADGALAVPALVEALDDPANQAKEIFRHPRVQIIQALRGIGPKAKPATAALAARVASDPDYTVRQYALQALASIGPDAKEAVPAVRFAFNDKMIQVRNEVAPALAKIGAVQALVGGLEEENAETRRGVIQALGGLKEHAGVVVPALAKQLRVDADALNRRTSAYSLGALGAAAAPATPDLAKALTDDSPEVRLAAADALGSIGPAASAAIVPLVDVMKTDKVDANREKAGWSLTRIDVKGQRSLVPDLTRLLADKNPAITLPAVYLLGQLGPDARDALPALQRLAQGSKGPLADAAAQAIRRIGN